MKRAATYARYSSDLQEDRSIEDQDHLNDTIAARHGLTIVRRFDDRELSAWAAVNRPGFLAMMQAAKAGEFEFIIGEDVDRIFRSQADYHNARRQLNFIGVQLVTNTSSAGWKAASERCSLNTSSKTWPGTFIVR